MNSFSLYRYQDDKPCLKLTLEISEERISWLIPKTDPLRKTLKDWQLRRPAVEKVKKPKTYC